MRAEIESPAPILNTPDFSFVFGYRTGNEIPLDHKGHPYCFEFVALPGTVFQLLDRCSEFIFHVSHPLYPQKDLFLDIRFAKPGGVEKFRLLPAKEEILKRMASLIGKPYVWGGNWSAGIPEILSLYPPKGSLDGRMKTLWTLEGVDCSGLLYETASGATPRNTAQLLYFGKSLKINGMGFLDVLRVLEPLDMIIYPGHVLFVLDTGSVVESKSPFGVIRRNLRERFGEIYRERKGIDEWAPELDSEKYFLVRRFP